MGNAVPMPPEHDSGRFREVALHCGVFQTRPSPVSRTYPWRRHTRGRPSHRGYPRTPCPAQRRHPGRPLLDHRCTRTPDTPLGHSRSPLQSVAVSIRGHPPIFTTRHVVCAPRIMPDSPGSPVLAVHNILIQRLDAILVRQLFADQVLKQLHRGIILSHLSQRRIQIVAGLFALGGHNKHILQV